MASNRLLAADSFLWALQAICSLHRIPFARELVRQQFPSPHDVVSLQQAAMALGLKAGIREDLPPSALAELPAPFVAILNSAVNAPEDSSEPSGTVIVLKCENGQVNYLAPEGKRPAAAGLSEFGTRFGGIVMLCSPGISPLKGEDSDTAESARFGFGWFIPELLKHKTIWRDVLLASLAIQLMALATPIFTQIVIDKVIVHQTVSTLAVIGVALAVFIVFSAVMTWVRQYLVLHTGNRIDAVLGLHVFQHLFRLPARYFERRPTGVLVARVQGVETIREFLSGAAVTLLLDVPFLLMFLAIMFYYSVTLTVVTVAVLLLIAGLSLAMTPVLRQRLNQQFLLGARNQAFLTEYVAGMETVKSLQMEPQLGRRFGDFLAAYLRAGFMTRQVANFYNVAAHFLEQSLTLIILCLGAWMVMTRGDFTIGMLVAFQMFAGRLSQPVLHLVSLWQQFQQASIAVRRLGDVMNAPAEPYSVIPAREAKGDGRLEVRGLSFRHAENLPYLYKSFSLTIEPGKCVAMMGPSGSGKSTFAKLLQGFYQAEEGSICIDGRDIRYLSANELRQHFGVVPQETVLFSGTIYDNLVLADSRSGFEEIVQACKLAEIHETIEQLPKGYQTQVGEHGAGLSGGQKQRIAIARALLKRPPMLIFDEATNGLDPHTAEQFARTVNQFRGRVTMLFIAHQLPKGLQVDNVVTLGQWATRVGLVGEDRRDG